MPVWAAAFLQKPGPAGRDLTSKLGNPGAQARLPSVEGQSCSGAPALSLSGELGPEPRWTTSRASNNRAVHVHVRVCVCVCVRTWVYLCVPGTYL